MGFSCLEPDVFTERPNTLFLRRPGRVFVLSWPDDPTTEPSGHSSTWYSVPGRGNSNLDDLYVWVRFDYASVSRLRVDPATELVLMSQAHLEGSCKAFGWSGACCEWQRGVRIVLVQSSAYRHQALVHCSILEELKAYVDLKAEIMGKTPWEPFEAVDVEAHRMGKKELGGSFPEIYNLFSYRSPDGLAIRRGF